MPKYFIQYGMMHRALVTTNSPPDYKTAILDAFTAFFQLWRKKAKIFEKRYQISLIKQGQSLLQNFSDTNVQPIEQRMLDQRPRESGILSTRTQSSNLT